MDAFKDERFAHVASDPRYKQAPKSQRKVKVDKRFKSIFHDQRFKVNYSVDKRGKPVSQSSSENFRKFYALSSDDSDEEETGASVTKSDDSNENKHVTSSKKSKKSEKTTSGVESSEEKLDDYTSDTSDENLVNTKSDSSNEESDNEQSISGNVEKKKNESNLVAPLSNKQKRNALSADIKEKLRDPNVDYARGMGTLVTDSSSEEDSELESDEGIESEVEHGWGELDRDADTTETSTRRLAICNMDWDRIRAVDLMVLCSSFVPSGGHIESITIYPSEYGLERIKEEEMKGPSELVQNKLDTYSDEESKEGSKYHMERLRQYQLQRLKYYYAVVVCDSVATASKIYSECDGMEYESSSTRLDLRFIPDDLEFDQEPKEVCTEVKDVNKYTPNFFVNTALQQGKVICTWDETDPAREQVVSKLAKLKGNTDIDDDDLQMFLASSSGEEDEDEGKLKDNESDSNSSQINDDLSSDDDTKDRGINKSIKKYQSLLNKIQEDEEKKKNRDVEMEITWGVGLKEKTKSLVDKKLQENKEKTPFESLIEKRKEKRQQKRKEKSKQNGNEKSEELSDNGVTFSDDELPDDIDLNDDYFKEEFDDMPTKTNKNKKDKKKNKQSEDNDFDADSNEKQKTELELLMIDNEEDISSKSHFSLKKIQESEAEPKKKRKKGRKQIKKIKQDEPVAEDNFQVDLKDDRFNAVYTMSQFNIDPSDPNFRKTKGMDLFVKEKINRKYKKNVDDDEIARPSKAPKLDMELSKVVASIKKKTKGVK